MSITGKILTVLALGAALAATSPGAARAAPTPARAVAAEAFPMPLPELTQDLTFDATLAERAAREWKEASRSPAAAGDVSPSFAKFRDRFLAVTSDAGLEALLEEAAKPGYYEQQDAGLQYFLAGMLLLRDFRGIIWRIRPIFEKGGRSFLGKALIGTPASHSAAVSLVRGLESIVRVNFPTPQWKAGFDYLTKPGPKQRLKDQFSSMGALQNYLASTVVKSHFVAIARIKALMAKSPRAVYVWDNRVTYGSGSFDDGMRRYVQHGLPEVNATLGGLHLAVHGLYGFAAYNQDAATRVMERLGKMVGIDGWSNAGDLGVTSRERSRILASFNNDRDAFLRLRLNPDRSEIGRGMMKSSFAHLGHAIKYFNGAYHTLQGARDNDAVALNPINFQRERERDLTRNLNQVTKMMEQGFREVRSPITGEVVQLDVGQLYNNPPPNLLDFLPNDWEGGNLQETLKNEAGETLTYRNYTSGAAKTWNTAAWQPYVPSVSEGPTHIAKFARTVRMNSGAAFLAAPLLGFAR